MESIIVKRTKPAIVARHAAVKALILAHQSEFDLLLAGEKAKIKASEVVSVPAVPAMPSMPSVTQADTATPVPSEESLGTSE